MPAIPLDVLVDALTALDRARRDPRIETGTMMACASAAGALDHHVKTALVGVMVDVAMPQPTESREAQQAAAAHLAEVNRCVVNERGVWGGGDSTMRFYNGERITRTEYTESARRQGFAS